MKLVAPRYTYRICLLVSFIVVMMALALVSPIAANEPRSLGALPSPTLSPDIDGVWSRASLFPRQGHTAIYDPVRNRMVIFGGFQTFTTLFNDVWLLTLSGSQEWTQLTPVGTPPSGRYFHSAIYDPIRDRMLIFGGSGSSALTNEVWALSLSGTPAWTQLAPTGTPPAAREAATAIYDPVRDRMVLFGGFNGSYFNDVWALSLSGTPGWTQVSVDVFLPPARSRHTAIYDPVLDRMVVFGGTNGTARNDTWSLSFSGIVAWKQISSAGTPPSIRASSTAIYDPVHDQMVVFGGVNGATSSNDAWTLSLSASPAWAQLAPSGSLPSARARHSAIYDPVDERMIVFGGIPLVNDSWSLALSGAPVWTPAGPPVVPPPIRGAHSAILDPSRDRMVIFGGANSSSLNDVWMFSLSGSPAWFQLAPTGTPPVARAGHTAIYDPVRDQMVVLFGTAVGPFRNDAWALSLTNPPGWTELLPGGTIPSGREGQTGIYDETHDRVVVFGGFDGSSYLNDLWALSLAGTPTWTQLSSAGAPPLAREYHSAIYDKARDRMVVFGGWNGAYMNDVWALSLSATPTWTELTPTGTPPSPRRLHSAIYDPERERMVVFGGQDGGTSNEEWALSLPDVPAWTKLSPQGPPPSNRFRESAIYDAPRDRMVIFGGFTGVGSNTSNDTWALSWAGEQPPNPVLFGRIAAIADNRGVLLSWKLEADEPVSGFEIYRRSSSAAERRLTRDLVDSRLRTLRDDDVEPGRLYQYFVVAVLPGGDRIQSQSVSVETQPLALTLHQNHPNPFNPNTTISFVLPAKLPTRVMIYDVQGRLVRKLLDETMSPGFREVAWDGRDEGGKPAASGVYFYVLGAGKNTLTRKMVLLK